MSSTRTLSLAVGASGAVAVSLLLLRGASEAEDSRSSVGAPARARAAVASVRPSGPTGLAAPAAEARAIVGIVVDPSGRALSGAALTAARGPGGPLSGVSTESDAAGRFALTVRAGPGRYLVRATRAGWGGRTVPAEPGTPLRIVLSAGGALDGSCRDAAGRAVAGTAHVLVGDWSVSGPVGVDGRFRFDDLPTGHARVRVVPAADGAALSAQGDALIEAGRTATVTLTHAGAQRLRGRVERPDGTPAAGADLRLAGDASTPGAARAVRADAQGRFALGAAPGEARLIARLGDASAGPLRVEVPLGEDPESIVVRLAPDPRPRVRVLGADGPLTGARVRLERDPLGLGFARGAVAQATGADGVAALPAVARGEYLVRVTAAGHARFVGRLGLSDGATVDVRLRPAASLAGVVRGPDGGPAADAVVRLSDVRPRVTRADAQGRFVFEAVEVGAALLEVRARGAGAARLEVALPDASPVRVLIDLPPPSALRGRVTLAGREVAGALVRVEGPDDVRDVTTDAQGRFAWTDLGRGPYRVEARAPGALPVAREGLWPGAALELALEPARTFLGVVRGPDGEPVHEATVGPADGSTPARLFPDGRFVITVGAQVSALRVRAQAHDPGGESCSGKAGLRPERVPLPPRSGRLDVRLSPGAAARGLVVDSEGRPVAGAAVRFGRAREEDLLSETAAVELLDMTEADGAFHAHGVPDGGLLVTVSHPRHAPAVVRLQPGRNRITLPRGARLSGSVRSDDGAPAAGVGVVIDGPVVRRTTTDVDGRFVAEGLAAGRYTVTRLGGAARMVTLRAGEQRALALD